MNLFSNIMSSMSQTLFLISTITTTSYDDNEFSFSLFRKLHHCSLCQKNVHYVNVSHKQLELFLTIQKFINSQVYDEVGKTEKKLLPLSVERE